MKKSILDRLEGKEFSDKVRHEFKTRLKIPYKEGGAIFVHGIQDFSGNGRLSEGVEFSFLMPAAMMVVAHSKGMDTRNALKSEFIMDHIQSNEYRLANIKHKAWLLSEEIIAMREMISCGPYNDADQIAIKEIFSWFTAGMPTFSHSERREKFWHNEFYGDVQNILEKTKVAIRGASIMLKQKVTSDSISRDESECIRNLKINMMDGSYYSPDSNLSSVPKHSVPTLKAFCAIRFSIFLALSIDGDICNPGWLRSAEGWGTIFGNDFD